MPYDGPMTETREMVQDQSTNNPHYRGADREDGTPTALCNRRYRVFTYATEEGQASIRGTWAFAACPRCEAKVGIVRQTAETSSPEQ